MQIFFVGDLHLGGKILKEGFKIPESDIITRDASLLTLKRALEQFEKDKPVDEPAMAIFAGDIVDGPAGAPVMKDFHRIMDTYIKSGVFEKVLLFPGNHDYEGDRLIIEELKNYSKPESKFVFLDRPVIFKELLNQQFIFLFFPYLPDSSEKEFAKYLSQANELKIRENRPLIVFAHGGIKEISEAVGPSQDYDFIHLDDLKEHADFTFLGHVHRPPAEIESYRIYYSGIIEPLKSDHRTAGYLKITLKENAVSAERKTVEPTVKFVKIKEKPGRVNEAVKRYFEEIKAELAKQKHENTLPALKHLSEVKFFSLDSEEQSKTLEEVKRTISQNKHLLPLQGREPEVLAIPEGVKENLKDEVEELKSTLKDIIALEKSELEKINELEEEIKWLLFFHKNEKLIEEELKIQI